MTFRGHVKNGVVVLDEPAILMEGAEVEIYLLSANDVAPPATNDLMQFAGKAQGLPADASENLDHYLYGYPKQ